MCVWVQLQQKHAWCLDTGRDRARLSGAGGQRQRQRIGPAPHDAPPSSAAVTQMGLEEVVTALTYCNSGATAVVACCRVAELCIEEGNRQLAVEVGAVEAGRRRFIICI